MNGDTAPDLGELAHETAGKNKDRLDDIQVQLNKQTRLLATLASVVRNSLKSGCAEARAITEQLHELRGSAQAHLRAEAKLQRELKEMRESAEVKP